MTQSLILIGLFLCVLVSLPFLIDRLKKHYGLTTVGAAGPARMVSALALGPQQKVVTVEVGPHNARVWLVLGVTQQSIQCLHTMPAETSVAPVSCVASDTAGALAAMPGAAVAPAPHVAP